MKKMHFRITAVLVAGLMLLSFVGCGSSKETTQSNSASTTNATNATNTTQATPEAEKPIEPVKMQILIGPCGLTGVQSDSIATEIFEKKFGLTFDFIFAGDQFSERLSALMASGDLPDLVCFKDKKQFQSAVQASLVMPMDDLVSQCGKDIQSNLPSMLQYMRDNYSNGTGKLFGLAEQVGAGSPTNSLHMALYTRWDLYKKLGSPELKTYDDMLELLKKMQAEYPKNDKGQKVYALQLWSDWDSISMSLVDFSIPGYKGVNTNSGTLMFTEYDLNTKQLKSVFDADSQYLKGVEFYYKANKMGILDPDSITQKWPNGETKTKEGRVLTAMWAWQAGTFNTGDFVKNNPQAGMIPLFPKDEAVCNLQADSSIGRDYIFGIGKNCKYGDRIIKLLNYSSTLEGSYTMMNGIKGKDWDINNGKAEYAPEKLEKVLKGDPSVINYEGFTMLNMWNIDPATGESITSAGWSQVVKKSLTSAEKEWAEANSAINVFDYAKKNLKVVQDDGVIAAASAAPDDIKVVQQKLGEVLKTISWKMVYAKSDAEFNTLKQQLIEKAKALGTDKNFEWAQKEYSVAKEKASKYTEYHVK